MSEKRIQPAPRPCACTTVRTASRVLARLYDDALQDADLNVTQLAVLRAIDRMTGEPLIRIADALSMDRTSVYRAVSKMERYGWLRVEEGTDARSRTAIVTYDGRVVLDRAAPRWECIQTAIIDRFGRRRWRALVSELRGLAETAASVERDRRAGRDADV